MFIPIWWDMGRPFTPSVISIELFKTKGPTVILKFFILTLFFLGEKRTIDVSVGAIHLGFPHISPIFPGGCCSRDVSGDYSMAGILQSTAGHVRLRHWWGPWGDGRRWVMTQKLGFFRFFRQKNKVSIWFYTVLLSWNQRATLLGTNISPEKSLLKMIFLFPRWDMLISWRVFVFYLVCIILAKYEITFTIELWGLQVASS